MARGMEQLRRDAEYLQTRAQKTVRLIGQDLEPLQTAAITVGAKILAHQAEHNLIYALHPQYPERFSKDIWELTETPSLFLLIGNHQSHADPLFMARVIDKIIRNATDMVGHKRIPGFVLPYATTVDTGHQGKTIQILSKEFKGLVHEHKLHPMSYTRKKDTANYGLPANHFEFGRKFLPPIKAGYGVALFPEATIQGGRITNGKINGMQPFKQETLDPFLKFAQRTGRQLVIVPVGLHGGFRFENVNGKNRPTTQATVGILTGFGLPKASIRVGEPITYEQIQQEMQQDNISFADTLGRKVARLVPPEARGVYADAA